MKNPFYTALLIVAIIVLIILFVFRNVDFSGEEESLGKLVFRGSIYMILLVTGIQFLNNKIWMEDTKHKTGNAELKEIFGGVEKYSKESGIKPVVNDAKSNAGSAKTHTLKGNGVVNFNIGPSTTGPVDLDFDGDEAPEPIQTVDITK